AAPETVLRSLADPTWIAVPVDESAEEVAHQIAHYDLAAIPIVDEAGRPLGLVTADDALDVLLPDEWKRQLPRVFR
ncbi:MAG: CBS domain-containing protein, partial [Chloroflexi bacterium]|nr:CBS domain-containing protein [Chloroflexota bacterium]